MKVEVREDPSGEWVEVLVDGVSVNAGHSIPRHDWIDLLKQAGVTVTLPRGAFDDGGYWQPGKR